MISSCTWHNRSAQRRPWRSFKQQFLGMRPRLRQRRFKALRHRGAQFALAAGIGRRKRLEIGDDRRGIDQFDGGAVRSLDVKHRCYA